MTNLGELMSLATRDLDSSETAAQIARRYQRRHRRGVVVSAVAGCCVAAAGAIAVSSSGVLHSAPDVDQVVPAAPTVSDRESATARPKASATATPRPKASGPVVAASVLGVDVTWLPAGMSWTHETSVGTSKDNGQPVTSTYFVGVGTGYPELSLGIQRNYAADLDSLSKEPSQSFEWVTIHGQRALMQDIEPMRHKLTWVDIKSKTTISLEMVWVNTKKTTTGLSNEGGLNDADLVRTVEGLIVGPSRSG